MDIKVKEAIIKVAPKYGLEPAVLLAVKQVETGNGTGMLANNTPQILFEGHIFYRLLSQKLGSKHASILAKKFPTLIYPLWTKKYYLGGVKEHERLNLAAQIDRELALESASWGVFQIMGFNWNKCKCDNLQDFINKNYAGLEQQIEIGCNFIKHSPNMFKKLQEKDWAGFAKLYNGSGYAANHYDQKLANAYNNFKRA